MLHPGDVFADGLSAALLPNHPSKSRASPRATPNPGQELGAGRGPAEGMGQGDASGAIRALGWEEEKVGWDGGVVSPPSGWTGCLHPAGWRESGWGWDEDGMGIGMGQGCGCDGVGMGWR